ncbi:MAG: M15 family metallopeptidase [Desulfovibrio sp.]|nr:M15 family metallopeptidase [Desulfovibrio sp.]
MPFHADAARREINAAWQLIRAYPDASLELERDDDGIYLRAGVERLLFSPAEGCPPPMPFTGKDQPLCASLGQPYPRGNQWRDASVRFEPGRVRSEGLLKLLYGKNMSEVHKNCVPVLFMGNTVLFNRRHGCAAALARVGQKLEVLASREPALREYILPIGGAFLWRNIRRSGRLSPHSFAIAIDLNVKKGSYWQWSKPSAPAARNARSRYPQAIVDAFESEGFIWGGKWYSFDFMHFEYRPELLQKEEHDS